MNDSQLPTAPATRPTEPAPRPHPSAGRTWRDRLPRRLPSGRRAVAAGAVVAGLAIGGAGFGVGYAVGDDGWPTRHHADRPSRTGPPTATGATGGFPRRTGRRDGRPARRPAAVATGGTTGQAPDFDGDGQPDTDSSSQLS